MYLLDAFIFIFGQILVTCYQQPTNEDDRYRHALKTGRCPSPFSREQTDPSHGDSRESLRPVRVTKSTDFFYRLSVFSFLDYVQALAIACALAQ